MVTKAVALAAYNQQHGTNYATVTALGTALANEAIKEAWVSKQTSDAHDLAAAEAVV